MFVSGYEMKLIIFLFKMNVSMKVVNDITHKIIGCAMRVHQELGCGFQELLYQRALAKEMMDQGIDFQRELEMEVFYKSELIGTRRVDFFVEDCVMLELKAVEHIEPGHIAQAINYCEAYKIKDGLLINFGSRSLEFKRLFNNKLLK
jgi:GxxExxY protein